MTPPRKPKKLRRTHKAFDEVTPLELATGLVQVVASEKEMEAACDRLAADLGADIVSFSQVRHTMQTPGIPDRRYRHRGQGIWFEVKAEDGKLSAEQLEFLIREHECGMIVGAGGRDELLRLLSAPWEQRYEVGKQLVDLIAARGLRKATNAKGGRSSRPHRTCRRSAKGR